MSKELPLKIRMDIRDLWDSPQSSVNASMESLKQVLGHTIVPRMEWPILWSELKDKFPDNTTFVPTIIRYAIAWYERLGGRLEHEAFEEWTEQLLSVLADGSNRKLTLHIEPAGAGVSRPSTKWNPKLAMFQLLVPNVEPASQSKLDSGFDKDFENLFNPDADSKEDDWAEVGVASVVAARASAPTATMGATEPPAVRRLPLLDALPRPQELFMSNGPYSLIVEERGPRIIVQCSHEPSLELLGTYLKRWAKVNPHDTKRTILKVELVESEYSFGMIDKLTIERTLERNHGGEPLNPTIVLAFIEGVLGYKLVNTTGSCRTYSCTTLLK